jgi:hypothetical protein
MQGQLFRQGLAQVVVVVDDQYGLGAGHVRTMATARPCAKT